MNDSSQEEMILPDIEGPAEFYDWDAEEEALNHLYDWKGYNEKFYQDVEAADLADELVEEEAMREYQDEVAASMYREGV